MPLLWKKRNQKVAAPVVVAEEAKSHKLCSGQDVLTVSSGEQKSTNDTCNNGMVFVFVIKDFTSTISDELSVGRGHVVQQLYEDSAWSYVRSIDGRSGYIPSSVTCSLDDIQSRGEWLDGRPISRKSKILLQNNTSNGIQSSQPAFQRRGVPSVRPKLNDPHTASNACTNHEASAIIELSSSPYAVPSLHPLHPLSLCKSMTPKSSSSSKHNSDCHPQPSFDPPSIAIHARTQSYQEAVTDHEPSSYHLYSVPIEHHSRPRNLPLRPNGLQSNQLTFTNTTSYTTTGLRTTTTHASQFDDVFLPCNNKPIGIFKSTGKYDKTVPGEVSLSQNEYVIVTEMGESEWAWIISASGDEGVVPKCLLARYNPAPERLDTVGTQTELIVMAPMCTIPARPLHQINRTTCTSREVETHTMRPEEPEVSLQRTEVAVQTDHMSPVIMDVWSQSQTIDEFWYENSMSIPRLNGFSFSGIESPSICTLPTINGINESAGIHESRHSLPHLPLFNTLHSKKSSTADVTATLDSNSSFSPASGVRPNVIPQNNVSSPQTIVLKVVRSYIPGANEVDHLHLNKGDILHIYPGNNTVQRNWIWAYHMEQGTYGYVPKSHTAFLCVTNFRHVNGGIIRYDEV